MVANIGWQRLQAKYCMQYFNISYCHFFDQEKKEQKEPPRLRRD